jgi:hypothetical protein
MACYVIAHSGYFGKLTTPIVSHQEARSESIVLTNPWMAEVWESRLRR